MPVVMGQSLEFKRGVSCGLLHATCDIACIPSRNFLRAQKGFGKVDGGPKNILPLIPRWLPCFISYTSRKGWWSGSLPEIGCNHLLVQTHSPSHLTDPPGCGQYHAIPFINMQYQIIPCNTIQFHQKTRNTINMYDTKQNHVTPYSPSQMTDPPGCGPSGQIIPFLSGNAKEGS